LCTRLEGPSGLPPHQLHQRHGPIPNDFALFMRCFQSAEV
jgi:hypothetical protein